MNYPNIVDKNTTCKCENCTYKLSSKVSFVATKIVQVDGNVSDISDGSSEDSQDSSNSTLYDTEDEAFSDPIPANLAPVPGQNVLMDSQSEWMST